MKPHILNLRKRAKALGLEITKITDRSPLDGMAEYVVHREGADYGHCRIVSIYGVAQTINRKEAMRHGSPS